MSTFYPLKIPSDVFTLLNEAILLFNKTVTLVYPEKKEKCPNCFQNTIGGRGVNFYKTGGPIPFRRGSLCPYCGGDGFKYTESKETVQMRVYYNRKEFVDIGLQVDIPQGTIQTVCYMDDYEKIAKAKEILVDVGKHNQLRYKRSTEPFVQGFKQNPTQYMVIFWERV